MTTALYRLGSMEVTKISLTDQTFSSLDPAEWGVLTNPTTPDGTSVRDESGRIAGPLRVEGLAKIAEPAVGPNGNVRNATQAEIDTFAAAEKADEDKQDADRAGVLLETHSQFRKLFLAFADIVRTEVNTLREGTFGGLTGATTTAQVIAPSATAVLADMAGSTALPTAGAIVSDNTAGVVTLQHAADYLVTYHVVFRAQASSTYTLAVFGNNRESVPLGAMRRIGSGGEAVTVTVGASVIVNSPVPNIDLTLRVSHDNASPRNFTPVRWSLNAMRLSYPPRTLAQMRTAIKNRINAND